MPARTRSWLALGASSFTATLGVWRLNVAVDDEAVRAVAPGFDGLERVFALVPHEDRWDRFELRFTRTTRANPVRGREHARDNHLAVLDAKDLDVPAIVEKGIASGMDTNVGTLWLQSKGVDFKPSGGRRRPCFPLL